MKQEGKNKGALTLLPILVFLVIYIGIGVYYEYVHPQEGVQGFYVMSVVVAFMAAIAVALFQNRSVSFDEKMRICASGMGDGNILIMIFIFLLAGAFSGVASASGCASDTANLLLSIVPGKLTVLGIFLIACIISMAMGTSCGTITVMGSLALSISQSAELYLPLCFGALVGGSMFGDNLSFISDTTIAALAGINVFIVLGFGLVLCTGIGLITGSIDIHNIFISMGNGVSGMYETIAVTILATALSALIKYNGGFETIIHFIKQHFHGSKGGQLGIIFSIQIMLYLFYPYLLFVCVLAAMFKGNKR